MVTFFAVYGIIHREITGVRALRERIYLSSPHMCGEEMNYVKQAFDTNWIAPLGPNVDAFEKEVAEYIGTGAAAALSSGTAAIHLALKLCGVRAEDKVFCSDLTFSGSCNPIIYENAVPVFIDSEEQSYNMSPAALEKAFNEHKPKAVIVVNLYGQSAAHESIKAICDANNTPEIEDAAESLGAVYKGKRNGRLGRYGIFSFNGNKIITTSGGGMLVSEDEEAVGKVRFWATQSRDKARHYQHSELGYNYRMSNVLAGVGRGQLTALGERVWRKKEIYEHYSDVFKEIDDIRMYPVADWGEPNYWLSVVILKPSSWVRPDDIMDALERENIESRPVWKPMHLQPFFEKYDFFTERAKGSSVGEELFLNGVCLPSDTKMSDEDLQYVCDIITGLF
jgi:dTDP-4-amino-4,6-dideoxygalactose transaminase